MANKELASASFSRVQRKLQTTEEVLAALLDSEDDSDAVDSYLSDDSSMIQMLITRIVTPDGRTLVIALSHASKTVDLFLM